MSHASALQEAQAEYDARVLELSDLNTDYALSLTEISARDKTITELRAEIARLTALLEETPEEPEEPEEPEVPEVPTTGRFGPVGAWSTYVHKPENSGFSVEAEPNWADIDRKLRALTDAQIASGATIKIKPGNLSGNGSSSGSTPVLQNFPRKGTRNILITPRDGYGTVKVTVAAHIKGVNGVSFARIAAHWITLTNCDYTEWIQSKLDDGFRSQASGNTVMKQTARLFEAYIPQRTFATGVTPYDPLAWAAGAGSQTNNSEWGNIYAGPTFQPVAATDHIDTLQMYGTGDYRGLTIRNSILWSGQNCALQIGGGTATTPFLSLDRVIALGSFATTQLRYPTPAGHSAPEVGQSINGAGAPGQLFAKDSFFGGSIYSRATWGEVINTKIDKATSSKVNKGAFTIAPTQFTKAWLDQVAPEPTDAYLKSIWK